MGRGPFTCLALAVLAGCGAEPRGGEGAEVFWSHRFNLAEDVAYGEDPAQKLDLYLQGSWVGEPTYFQRAPDARPTLLFIHGGGWIQGDKTGQEPWLLPFVERGWHVANMNYRQGPGTAPAAVDDALCALKWVVDNAARFGFDAGRIVVSGGSAGGHLALVTGILGSREGHPCYPGAGFRVGAVVNWYGITDIEAVDGYLSQAMPEANYARAWAGDEARIPELSARYSPIHMVDAGAPPVLTIHGDADSVVPHAQAVSFHARLAELGTVHELRSMPGGTHGGFTEAQFQEAFGAIFAFLAEAGVHR